MEELRATARFLQLGISGTRAQLEKRISQCDKLPFKMDINQQSVIDSLSTNKIIVDGGPGCGKTTLIGYIANLLKGHKLIMSFRKVDVTNIKNAIDKFTTVRGSNSTVQTLDGFGFNYKKEDEICFDESNPEQHVKFIQKVVDKLTNVEDDQIPFFEDIIIIDDAHLFNSKYNKLLDLLSNRCNLFIVFGDLRSNRNWFHSQTITHNLFHNYRSSEQIVYTLNSFQRTLYPSLQELIPMVKTKQIDNTHVIVGSRGDLPRICSQFHKLNPGFPYQTCSYILDKEYGTSIMGESSKHNMYTVLCRTKNEIIVLPNTDTSLNSVTDDDIKKECEHINIALRSVKFHRSTKSFIKSSLIVDIPVFGKNFYNTSDYSLRIYYTLIYLAKIDFKLYKLEMIKNSRSYVSFDTEFIKGNKNYSEFAAIRFVDGKPESVFHYIPDGIESVDMDSVPESFDHFRSTGLRVRQVDITKVTRDQSNLKKAFLEYLRPDDTVLVWGGSESKLITNNTINVMEHYKEFLDYNDIESKCDLSTVVRSIMGPSFTFFAHRAFEDALLTYIIFKSITYL